MLVCELIPHLTSYTVAVSRRPRRDKQKSWCLERADTYIINIEQLRRKTAGEVILDAGLLSPQEMGHFL